MSIPKDTHPSVKKSPPSNPAGVTTRRGNHTVNDLSTEEAIAKYGSSLIFVGGSKPLEVNPKDKE